LVTIPLLKRLRVGQTILKYVEEHKQKNGTPTMGGLFFIGSAIIVFFIVIIVGIFIGYFLAQAYLN
jgi:phospho-N-acetylmuramoyl-pentapeptide-transferase